MRHLQPILALKALIGYGAGHSPQARMHEPTAHLQNVLQRMDSFVDPAWAFYEQQMKIGAARLQIYKELEEMDSDDIVSAAADLYAEDATQLDIVTGRTIWVSSKNPKIQELGNTFLTDIDVEDKIFPISRNLGMYGDDFENLLQELRSDGTPGGIVGITNIPHMEIHRHSDELGRLCGFSRGPTPDTKRMSMPWDYVHFRLLGLRRHGEYGTSLFINARRLYRMLRLCLSGNVRVSLLDGTEETLKSLSKRNEPFWVYSYDTKNKKIVAGKATASMTRKNAKLVEVELDNGEKVRCTPDHRWMRRDGTYCEAKDLKPGDSLMPLYRRFNKRGYEELLDVNKVDMVNRGGAKSPWVPTHRLAVFGKKKEVVHHKNFNKHDNRPENLTWMLASDHRRSHRDLIKAAWSNPRLRAERIRSMQEATRTPEHRLAMQCQAKKTWTNPKSRQNRVDGLKGEWAERRQLMYGEYEKTVLPLLMHGVTYARIAKKTGMSVGNIERIAAHFGVSKWKKIDERNKEKIVPLVEAGLSAKEIGRRVGTGADNVNRIARKYGLGKVEGWNKRNEKIIIPMLEAGVRYQEIADKVGLTEPMICHIAKQHGIVRRRGPRPSLVNHKVVSVQVLSEREDCYDLTIIDGPPNFALSAGVFSHNCEDAISVYRIKRAPDRLKFMVDGRNMSVADGYRLINELRQQWNRRNAIDPATGQYRTDLNPQGIDDNIWWLRREGDTSDVTKMEGSSTVGHVLDVDYLRKRLYSSIKVPADYLGFAENKAGWNAGHQLSQQDIRFARGVRRLQRSVIDGFTRMLKIHFCWCGIDVQAPENEFHMMMNAVSYLDEMQKGEYMKVRAETMVTLQSIGEKLGIPKEVWLKYVWKFSGFPEEFVFPEENKPVELQGEVMVEDKIRDALCDPSVRKLIREATALSSGAFMQSWPCSRVLDVELPLPFVAEDVLLEDGTKRSETRQLTLVESKKNVLKGQEKYAGSPKALRDVALGSIRYEDKK